MKKCLFAVLLSICATSSNAQTSFVALDVFVETNQDLAAWQFELTDSNGLMTVVGIENGDSAAFRATPYYDRDAVSAGTADRIVVADFSLNDVDELPSGRVRIATVHVMLAGDSPNFEIELITATTHDGNRIDASISVREKQGAHHEPT